MPTLLLRLTGPMQSWGTTSRFEERDTGKEPSKSGVIGILAAAIGIDRGEWGKLEPIARLRMGVRHDRSGTPRTDYQTAACARGDAIIRADGSRSEGGGVLSSRAYLADASFLAGLEGSDMKLLERCFAALLNPVWPLFLGRKSYVASEPMYLRDGLRDEPLREALTRYPWLGPLRPWEKPPQRLLISIESEDAIGSLRMDQPLSSFADRKFGIRFVASTWIDMISEESHVSA